LNSTVSDDYKNLTDDLHNRLMKINTEVDDKTRAQWSSPLYMAYHLKKHQSDFIAGKELNEREYFQEYANEFFKPENVTGISNSQENGTICRSYAISLFGKRIFGFTSDETRLTYFPEFKSAKA
jgi:hypothetical protein